MNFLVITTIQSNTEALGKFEKIDGWQTIVVGDRKGPQIWPYQIAKLYKLDDQFKLPYKTIKFCPENHYSRKNLGYLEAIRNKAEIIGESDDDNIPAADWGKHLSFQLQTHTIITGTNFYNAYNSFTNEDVWPRGYPLRYILNENTSTKESRTVEVGVWQSLADGDTDVDAIYRLIKNKEIHFSKEKPIVLDKNVFCPFNSQNTFWQKKAFPLLYLPISVNFRFTDILRGYITQKILWNMDLHLGFCSATVYQCRNQHNLLKDFQDEVSMYLQTEDILSALEALKTTKNPINDLVQAYEILHSRSFVNEIEMHSVNAWAEDINALKPS